LRLADSVAVDPHKWLYAPIEAGCALVRNHQVLIDAFSYHPTYYRFDDHAEEQVTNFYELGLQNSRGFRALKVWLALRQAGKEGYISMLRDDCRLAEHLFQAMNHYPEIEPLTRSLSITTFRYVPTEMRGVPTVDEEYLTKLNTEILSRLQNSGKAYPSNALVSGKYAIRVCIVNFRSTTEDVEALLPMVVGIGREVDRELRAL
jgi:aromatic-L-amino-acid decarboxylase